MWKYVDDSTIAETVQKNEVSQIQEIVDRLVNKTHEDKFQMNESKCKEIRISFAKTEKVLACPVYHDGLPEYLSNDLKRIQKRAMHIIYPSLSYHAALLTAELVPLSQRRQQLTDKLFQQSFER